MKNPPPFSNNSRIALVFSLLVLFAGIYFGGSQMMMEDHAENQSNPTVISLSQGGPMNFVSPSDESSTNDTDLVARYSHLYGKYQVKINTKRNLSLPSDQEIEALRMEANQLNELYFKMSHHRPFENIRMGSMVRQHKHGESRIDTPASNSKTTVSFKVC